MFASPLRLRLFQMTIPSALCFYMTRTFRPSHNHACRAKRLYTKRQDQEQDGTLSNSFMGIACSPDSSIPPNPHRTIGRSLRQVYRPILAAAAVAVAAMGRLRFRELAP